DEDGVDVVRHLVLVPDLDDIAAKHIAQGVDGVALAVRSGEDNDGPACGHRAASLESTMLHVKSSRSGLLSVSVQRRSISGRASSTLAASISSMNDLPARMEATVP